MDPIMIIPGFMGSSLTREADGLRIWVEPTWAAAHADEFLENLALRTPGDSRLVPSAVLHDVDIADLIRVGVYRGLHEFCLSVDGLGLAPRDYHEFPYDWRKSLEGTASELAAAILAIPNPPITVIAHSQGGLVLTALFRGHSTAAARLSKIFAVGCPFAGLVKTIAMIEHGTGILGALFPADPIRTLLRGMPGTYDLFPSRATTGLFRDPEGSPAAPFHDITWFSSALYDRTLLKTSGATISALSLQMPIPLRLIEGYGVTTATLATATTDGLRVEVTIQGDGTCPSRSLTAATGADTPAQIGTRILSIPFGEHVDLIRRPEFLAYLRDDLTGAVKKPQVAASVHNRFQPAGTQNLLIVETRGENGEPLGTGTPIAQSQHGLTIPLSPCPIAKTARWVGPFEQPAEPDRIIITVPNSTAQPLPIIVAGT